ncbi:MAG: hypothetical protein AVDCRST_MAG26-4662, partial [uncultured Chloroflexia bacterium]
GGSGERGREGAQGSQGRGRHPRPADPGFDLQGRALRDFELPRLDRWRGTDGPERGRRAVQGQSRTGREDGQAGRKDHPEAAQRGNAGGGTV